MFPSQRRGDTTFHLRGDLAAFLHIEQGPDGAVLLTGTHSKTAVPDGRNGGSGEVLASLVAGTGFEPVTFRL